VRARGQTDGIHNEREIRCIRAVNIVAQEMRSDYAFYSVIESLIFGPPASE
jgi:hypothetical protein